MAGEEKYRNAFGEWAKAVQSRVQFEYECSRSVIDQGVLLGTIREAVIRNILKEFLPNSLEIGTGQIVDWQGTSSRQIDIVISKNSLPAFRFMGGCSAFLLESVLATIEVKSMLYGDKLFESLDNLKSVKDLQFMVHLRAKGPKLFDEAFEWIQKQGGLNEVLGRIKATKMDNPIACPDDIWSVLRYVMAWLHWETGDFSKKTFWEENSEMFSDPEFDFFSHLLTHTLGEKDVNHVLLDKWKSAGAIKTDFFKQLYDNLFYESLPPATFVLAYKGYEKLENLVEAVRAWFKSNLKTTKWSDMPTVIMNQRMVMYRHHNEYHCVVSDCPSLFFLHGLCSATIQEMSFQINAWSATQLNRYFDLSRILKENHPKNSESYLIWTIPLDGKFEGEILAPNRKLRPVVF